VHSINQNRLHTSIRHVPPTEYEPEQPADAADDLTAAGLRQVPDALAAHRGQKLRFGLRVWGGRAAGRVVAETGQDRELVAEDLLAQQAPETVS
jgi:hypothetical protein